MNRVITISLGLAVFGFAAEQTRADNCVFDTTSGVWSDFNNWTDCGGGTPGSDDTAKILSGQTCSIENDDQAADSITVDAGGWLDIKAKKLNLHSSPSTINGTVFCDSDAPTAGRIASPAGNDLTLNGSGNIDGPPGDLYTLTGWNNNTLTIGTGLTVEGSFQTLLLDLVNNGLMRVDHADDGGRIGHNQSEISGSGTFEITAGTLTLESQPSFGVAPDLLWKVAGGTLAIASCTECDAFPGDFLVTSGTVDIDVSVCAKGNLTFSGGTIDVANLTSAHFSAASCP